MQKNGMDDVEQDLSLRFYKDRRVIRLITSHPLFFVTQRIKDENDIRPIMIPYFGKFVFKYTKTLENKKNNKKRYENIIAHRCNQIDNDNVMEVN